MHTGVTITTPRLALRELSVDDLMDMTQLCMDPEVTRHISYIKCTSVEGVRAWLEDKIAHNHITPRFSYNFAIQEKGGNNVGWIGIGQPSSPDQGDLDFGYAIKKKYWGKGYATEALKGLLDFAFSQLGAHKITGECDTRNTASQKVMTKVGMQFEKEVVEENGDVSKRFVITSNP